MIEVYTDGSSLGNPGPGGWGFVIAGSPRVEKAGGVHDTTNNRMELMAVIEALKYLLDEKNISYTIDAFETDMGLFAAPSAVESSERSNKRYEDAVALYTDSNYVKQGITEWIHTWIKRNWRLSKGGKLVKNADLWKELHGLVAYFDDLSWNRVKAHVGNELNERVDDLARSAAEGL